MHLKLFPKSETGLFNEVDDTTVIILDNPVNDRQRFEFIIHYGKFVFRSKHF